jgi:NAD(P)-dependent dehydrogenase (short-subunit alcohol dehydrogenase family)
LEGQVVLAIGASRGMGKRMAIELARHGADVAVAARTMSPSESDLPGTILATAEEIRALGRRAEPIRVDLEIGAQIDTMVARTYDLFGRIDIVVHSVQYHGPGGYDSFFDTTIDQLETQMWVNTMSAVRICKLVVPHMATQGGGTIVLVTSGAGRHDTGRLPGHGATGLGYPISKAALARLVPALAKEVEHQAIAVIGLDPGFVRSEHVEAAVVGDDFRGWTNLEEAAPPTMPAKAAAFLCTSDNPMIYTGREFEAASLVADHNLV